MAASGTSVVASIGSWICLWAGLITLCLCTAAPRTAAYADASARTQQLQISADAAEDNLARLQRITTALKSDAVFRNEWLRAEWGGQPLERVESVEIPESLSLSPAASSAASLAVSAGVPNEPRLSVSVANWAAGLNSLNIRQMAALTATSFGLIGIGVLGPIISRKLPVPPVVKLWTLVSQRYRVDGPHSPAKPHIAPVAEVEAPVEEDSR